MKLLPYTKNIQKAIFLLACVLFLQSNGFGQILTFEFSSLAGGEATATSNFNDPNLTSSTISRGAGLTAAANGGRFNATSWALTSIANAVSGNDYMEFTITPNGGYQFDVSSVIISLQRSSTGPSAIALRNSVDGYTSNLDAVKAITDTTITQTFTFTFSQANSSAAVTYRIYMYAEATAGTGGPGDFAGNDIIVNGTTSAICTPVSEPAVNASAYTFSNIGCNGVEISWTSPVANDYSLVVMKSGSDVTTDPVDGTTYISNSTFGSGTDIGTSEFVVYNGNATSVIVTGLSASTSYYVNVFEYNGASSCIDYRTSDEVSSSIASVSCDTCAYLTSALINSCDNLPCTEGDNEMLFFNSGNYYVNTNAAGITVNYGSTSPAPNTYADSFTANPNAIDSMNIDAGCAGVYIDASTISFIPPNSAFLLLNETVCADAFDWSSMCAGASNIYVLFSSDVTWSSTGQFSNNPPSSGRFFRTIMEGCTIDYLYDSLNFPSNNGAIAFWDNSGGLSTSYDTNGCSLPATVLPIKLLYFTANYNGTTVDLNWSTTTEINNDYFTIERSADAINFEPILAKDGAGNSSQTLFYTTVDSSPLNGVSYYRLKQTDFNGDFAYSKIVSINIKNNDAFQLVNTFNSENNFLNVVVNCGENRLVNFELYDMTGKKVHSSIENIVGNNQTISIPIAGLSQGIYLLKANNGEKVITKKLKL